VLCGVVNPASMCQLASGNIRVYLTFELNTDVGLRAHILQSQQHTNSVIPVQFRKVNLTTSVRGLDHGTFHFTYPVLGQKRPRSLLPQAKAVPEVLSESNAEACQKTCYQGQMS